ncbi:hypothetical protein L6452_04171 [Arctium lappa]|uniref:Uncharacterized protein n=1 Tax=Arctium lappa TaxID=4217 RepID=A0ACB9FQ93_ARCLA|nr:hypothetical protein L6452_04171 [Arctium lappa]
MPCYIFKFLEDARLFSLRRRIIVLNFLDCWLMLVLFMGTLREATITGFLSGKFLTLVATNVAARGPDINDIQLIIRCEPPRDVEDYIHRSGRTGRAGNSSVAITLYEPRRSNISKPEREAGVKFEHISSPQPVDIAAVGADAVEAIIQVGDSFSDVTETALRDY